VYQKGSIAKIIIIRPANICHLIPLVQIVFVQNMGILDLKVNGIEISQELLNANNV